MPDLPAPPAPPACRIVTGMPGSGKTRWISEAVGRLVLAPQPARVGILQLELGRTRIDPKRLGWPEIRSRLALSPCQCCPPPLDLAGLAAEWTQPPGLEWLFVEAPAISFNTWLADFDRSLGWPRRIVVCLNRPRASQRTAEEPSFFMKCLLEMADEIVSPPSAPPA